jgi:hypothetical protein
MADDSENKSKQPANVYTRYLRKPVDLDKLCTLSENLIARQLKALAKESHLGKKLSRDDAQALINYTKLLKDLQERHNEELEKLPVEELDKL